MTALLAVHAFDEIWDVSPMMRYGLLALRHRGNGLYIVCHASNGSVSCRESTSISKATGRGYSTAIAAILSGRSSEERLATAKRGSVEVVVLASRRSKTLEDVASAIASISSDGLERSYVKLSEELREHNDIPSFLALTSRGELVAHRDSLGLTHLAIGGYGFDLAIAASETSAIEVLDGDVRRFMNPGELIVLTKRLVRATEGRRDAIGLCLLEFLYMSRHDSVMDGVSVYEFRKSLGSRLAERARSNDGIDVVVGVPESAIPYAIGLAERLGRPYDVAFVPTIRMRSMLKSNPLYKMIAIHLKMNPVRSALEGKKVGVVDDSMVTGATAKTVSQLLRLRIGAEEVHLFIASPPILEECPYSLMSFDKQSLVAANLSQSDIESYLEVDSLTWLSLEDVRREAEARGLSFCARCFGCLKVGRARWEK